MSGADLRARARILRGLGFLATEPLEAPPAGAPARRADSPATTERPPAEPAPRGATKRPPAAPLPSTLLEPPADWRGPNLATREERLGALAAIAAEIDGCRACGLCHGRNKTVPGDGDPLSPLVFVGEGPGADEDQSGIPFVGRAGQLLTKMIEAMGYQRSEVFILNIVKCRPPGNRAPLPEEMDACLPYLRRQLDVIRPRVMVCLGATAVGALFPEHAKTGITKLRGQWLKFGPADAMPTYHPSYLLRNPAAKRPVWEDLQQVMKVFGKGGK